MGGNTGNIRTRRLTSSSNGNRTFFSLVADGASAGAGSTRRISAFYLRNTSTTNLYNNVFGLKYGQFKNIQFSQ